jgi:hypothetical protein
MQLEQVGLRQRQSESERLKLPNWKGKTIGTHVGAETLYLGSLSLSPYHVISDTLPPCHLYFVDFFVNFLTGIHASSACQHKNGKNASEDMNQ